MVSCSKYFSLTAPWISHTLLFTIHIMLLFVCLIWLKSFHVGVVCKHYVIYYYWTGLYRPSADILTPRSITYNYRSSTAVLRILSILKYWIGSKYQVVLWFDWIKILFLDNEWLKLVYGYLLSHMTERNYYFQVLHKFIKKEMTFWIRSKLFFLQSHFKPYLKDLQIPLSIFPLPFF